jgi:hypothetical protein
VLSFDLIIETSTMNEAMPMNALQERVDELTDIEYAIGRAIRDIQSGVMDHEAAWRSACRRVVGLEQIREEQSSDLVLALYHIQLCIQLYSEVLDYMHQQDWRHSRS